MTEDEKIDLLIELFGWDNSELSRYSALRLLRLARKEPVPAYDDFLVHRY